MSAIQNVLNALRKAKSKGITPLDFPKAFRLGGRVYDLRKKGFDIITNTLDDTRIARYILKGEPKLFLFCIMGIMLYAPLCNADDIVPLTQLQPEPVCNCTSAEPSDYTDSDDD